MVAIPKQLVLYIAYLRLKRQWTDARNSPNMHMHGTDTTRGSLSTGHHCPDLEEVAANICHSLWMRMGLGWLDARRMSSTKCRRTGQPTSMVKWGHAGRGDADAHLLVPLYGYRTISVSEDKSFEILRSAYEGFSRGSLSDKEVP